MAAIGIRWTVGNVSQAGFAALRLSVWGARRAFGSEAALAICVNSLDLNQARESTGALPDDVEWIAASSPTAQISVELRPNRPRSAAGVGVVAQVVRVASLKAVQVWPS